MSSNNRSLLVSLILFVSLFSAILFATDAQADGATQPGALTPPPPPIVDQPPPPSAFDPAHDYLEDGLSNIAQTPHQSSATINGTTHATQLVDQIGVTFYLHRWTGNQWENVGNPIYRSSTQKTSFSINVTWNVTAGYYYRAKTLHWVMEGGIYEQGERISNYILIPSS
ncbi:hypothetical protein PAECIP111893_03968 [Paenibacillus plantiphilus]|uniref:Uncharacterized protein n=1 Tax=Paenibacillus plantiphilus TaxID=2905650 RepID=A0ABM9CJR2_9BACL|nr:DUF6147 family protein [Paenibacillus plantiphilus]CAH1215435.1 hypothetical protein PAECIP111893_03968 [Paenibacillus plantiphilus]